MEYSGFGGFGAEFCAGHGERPRLLPQVSPGGSKQGFSEGKKSQYLLQCGEQLNQSCREANHQTMKSSPACKPFLAVPKTSSGNFRGAPTLQGNTSNSLPTFTPPELSPSLQNPQNFNAFQTFGIFIFFWVFFLEPSAAGRSRGDERRGGRAAKFPPVGAGLSSSILKSSNPRSRSSSGLGSDPSGQFQRESFPGSSRGRIPAPNPAPGWIKHKLKQGKTWRKSGFAAGFGSGARRALELIFPLIFPGFSRWFFGNG